MNPTSLIEENIRLVHYIANKYRRSAQACGEDYDDIVGAGCVGLVKASKDFDPSLGFAFSTYASSKIRGAILIHFRDRGGPVKVPRLSRELAYTIKSRGLEGLTPELIAAKTGAKLNRVKSALESMDITTTHLQSSQTSGDDSLCWEEVIPTFEDFTNALASDFQHRLTELERNVLKMRIDDITQSEIGSMLGTSQVQVSRILKRIGKKYLIYEKGEAV